MLTDDLIARLRQAAAERFCWRRADVGALEDNCIALYPEQPDYWCDVCSTHFLLERVTSMENDALDGGPLWKPPAALEAAASLLECARRMCAAEAALASLREPPQAPRGVLFAIGVEAMTAQSNPDADALTYRKALITICNMALKAQGAMPLPSPPASAPAPHSAGYLTVDVQFGTVRRHHAEGPMDSPSHFNAIIAAIDAALRDGWGQGR